MKLLFILGTRPEAIKLAPLILRAREDKNIETVVCVTAQHRQMMDQVLELFNIKPDIDLNLMKHNQSLQGLTILLMEKLSQVIKDVKPDFVLVQGDTTTAMVGALCAFYERVKIAHVEAGLRSYNLNAPFPEEMNRCFITQIADVHLCPSELAVDNLKKENKTTHVYNTGNTVIDALKLCLALVEHNGQDYATSKFPFIDFNKRVILITGHRRENFGEPLKQICEAFRQIAEMKDIELVYPVHLNPNVKEVVHELLGSTPNIHLIEPLSYPEMVWLMSKSYFIITDSGGIQEEAPALAKPVLVTREVTERMEVVLSGSALLIGHDTNKLIEEASKLYHDDVHYSKMAHAVNPYGDGTSSEKILATLSAIYKTA